MHRLPVGSVILLLILAVTATWWLNSRPLRYPPGVLVPLPPIQQDIEPQDLGEIGDFHLTAFARYTLRGRVLGKKRYFSGIQRVLVPVDVAVGWGRMSDQSVLDHFTLTMGNRFFFYEWQGQPVVPPEEIKCSAANNHVIAATNEVERAVGGLRVGQLIEMRGWLVDATGPNGFRWPSSRRRDDTGNGACELFFVESVRVLDRMAALLPPEGNGL